MRVTPRYVATGSADCFAKVSDRQLRAVHVLRGHTAAITTLEVHSESHIVTGSADSTARLWDIGQGRCSQVLRGHTGPVLCVRLDDRHVVTCAEDETVRMWHRGTGECFRLLEDQPTAALALHQSSILVTTQNRALCVWDLLARGEHLRTIPLTDDKIPVAMRFDVGSAVNTLTNHLVLDGDRVVCDLGHLVKVLELPFPAEGRYR